MLFIFGSVFSAEFGFSHNSADIDGSSSVPFNSVGFHSYYQKENQYDCYGFVVPLPSGEQTTNETFQNNKVRHLINDLLREDIVVYWSACSFCVLSKGIDNQSNVVQQSFSKGDFVIPFSGEIDRDARLISIVYDYNISSEISDDDSKTVVYKLMSLFSFDGYRLVEPKIVQHLGIPIRYGYPIYLQVAEAGGFFSMEFLLDNETAGYLNNDDYNVLMWPYNPNPGKSVEVALSVANKDGSNAIRKFVRDGGGYIGSCYGGQVASAGYLLPIPLFSLRHAYNPDIMFTVPFIGLSISDTLMRQKSLTDHHTYIATSEIVDTNNPLAYGINKTVDEFFNGALFLWLGPHSGAVATYTGLKSEKNGTVNPFFERKVVGTPSWVYSTFGNGTVVMFGAHPEQVNNLSLLLNDFEWEGDPYYGRRTIHNALFYATSEDLDEIEISMSYPVYEIEMMGERTVDLVLPPTNDSLFETIKIRLHTLNENLSLLRHVSTENIALFSTRFNEKILEKSYLLYPPKYMVLYCDFFTDYINKTFSHLDFLDSIYPLLFCFNDSVLQLIDDLKIELSDRLNHSEYLVNDIIADANELRDMLQNNKGFVEKISIILDSRSLLRTFEIGLKYIPQTHLESLKLMRCFWYLYEANIAVSNT